MRRYFEFGWNQDFAAPHFELNSNTDRQHGQTPGDLPPIWISMPFKADLLEILNGVSNYGVDQYTRFWAQMTDGGATDAPLDLGTIEIYDGPDGFGGCLHHSVDGKCHAQHVVNGTNTYGWKIQQLFLGGIWQMMLGGFPKVGGGFTPPLFAINVDGPPTRNG